MKRLLLLIPALALLAACDLAHVPEFSEGPGCQWDIANPPEAWHHSADYLQVDDIDVAANYTNPTFPDETIDVDGAGPNTYAPSNFPFRAFVGDHPGTYTFDIFVTWRSGSPNGDAHAPQHFTIQRTC